MTPTPASRQPVIGVLARAPDRHVTGPKLPAWFQVGLAAWRRALVVTVPGSSQALCRWTRLKGIDEACSGAGPPSSTALARVHRSRAKSVT